MNIIYTYILFVGLIFYLYPQCNEDATCTGTSNQCATDGACDCGANDACTEASGKPVCGKTGVFPVAAATSSDGNSATCYVCIFLYKIRYLF